MMFWQQIYHSALFYQILYFYTVNECTSEVAPVVVNTWPFTNATSAAWTVLSQHGTAIDAVVAGCSECEQQRCDGTVGYGGDPDEDGETTLDAMIMDGTTHDVGAVGDLRRVKEAIAVAHAVMQYTKHTLLVGEQATKFAVSMGFKSTDLHTNGSEALYKAWKANKCQPNYWQNVSPDPTTSCGPYKPNLIKPSTKDRLSQRYSRDVSRLNHDTIGMVALDEKGHVAAGTSTNGLDHKIPGRVGDSPIMGAGCYAEADVGGAAATGDGDVMMRFLPSYHAVLLMSGGAHPAQAAQIAIAKIAKFYPNYHGAVVALSVTGEHGAACHNLKSFPYSVYDKTKKTATVIQVPCTSVA